MSPQRKAFLQVVFGGLLPILAFTAIEEWYGIFWGLIVGMVFCVGEMGWEWLKHKKVSAITWSTAALILVLGGLSLWAQEGIWFKLQPALLEAAFCVLLIGSVLAGRPFLTMAMEKSGQPVPPFLKDILPRLTLRLGLFFGLHSALAVWAALSWSTSAWAFLKGAGFTVSFVLYMVIELYFMRRRIRQDLAKAPLMS